MVDIQWSDEISVTKEDTVRVLRIVEYVGPRSKVEAIINNSLHGSRQASEGRVTIRAATIGNFPEILKEGE